MAISRTVLTSDDISTDLSSYVTASISPNSNRLLIAITGSVFSADINIPTISGNGLTWERITGADNHLNTAGTRRRIAIFAALTGSSPSAGSVTFDYSGQTQSGSGWIIYEVTGAYINGTASDAIRQVKIASQSSGAFTNPSLDSTSLLLDLLIAYTTIGANEPITQRSGWTEDYDSGHGGPNSAYGSQSFIGIDTELESNWLSSVMNLISGIEVYESTQFPTVVGTPFFTTIDAKRI